MSKQVVQRYVVGLTGGVASGKSAASEEFARLGVQVIDVDVFSRELSGQGGAAVAAIATAFPDCATEGSIDRAELRKRVFSDPAARRTLEGILHPMIRERTLEQLANGAHNHAPYVLLVVPLLFESSAYASLVAVSVVVDVPVSTQLERLHTQRGIDDATARGIVGAQLSREERLSRAQFVLSNTGSLDALSERVRVLHSVVCANARASVRAGASAMVAA
ncbi:MAG: dephospho-CoA kinase [Burkholderiales bacterium]|nr:MAG: dephospho-CoA kinase [Burkholderiales bacterium]TAG82517.1 MAG: dephospho-CoA kinase [Betaproteobacteria bacterium]